MPDDVINQRAVDLFVGGESRIRQQWTDALKKRLSDLGEDGRKALGGYLFPYDENKIERVLKGEDRVTTTLLQRFSSALNLFPTRFLKGPNLDNEQVRSYWQAKMTSDLAFAAAGTGGRKADSPKLTLETYIILTALEELD
jgi:hypothetical protein